MNTDQTNATEIDVYRDIHKGIRGELFAVTMTAATLDAGDECARAGFAERVRRLHGFLADHARHEDDFFQPLLDQHVPALGELVTSDHALLESSIDGITKAAGEAVSRADLQELHLELSLFTSSYLRHQDLEEREVQPALVAAGGVPALAEAHQRLLATIPPPEMAESLAVMLPAMNVDDRTELLGGIQAGAPAEVFAGICALAESVLVPADMAAVRNRLGL